MSSIDSPLHISGFGGVTVITGFSYIDINISKEISSVMEAFDNNKFNNL